DGIDVNGGGFAALRVHDGGEAASSAQLASGTLAEVVLAGGGVDVGVHRNSFGRFPHVSRDRVPRVCTGTRVEAHKALQRGVPWTLGRARRVPGQLQVENAGTHAPAAAASNGALWACQPPRALPRSLAAVEKQA